MSRKVPFPSLKLVVALVGTGLLLYLFFRQVGFLRSHRLFHIAARNMVVYLCIYNLPGALWLYTVLESLKNIWREQLYTRGLPWFIGSIGGTILTELAQKLHLITGTFDWLDIVAYLMAAMIFILLNAAVFKNRCDSKRVLHFNHLLSLSTLALFTFLFYAALPFSLLF